MTNYHVQGRRSVRLKGYDYRQKGAYFITLCTHEKKCLWGEITDGQMKLSPWGSTAAAVWQDIPKHNENVELDEITIMPNHLHGILVLTHKNAGQSAKPSSDEKNTCGRFLKRSLAAIVGSYKSAVSRRINAQRDKPAHPIWQRNYYEHIIRDEEDLDRIRAYIAGNIRNWLRDEYFEHL